MSGATAGPFRHARRMPAAVLLAASFFLPESASAARVVLTGDAFVSGHSAEERAKNFGADKKLVVNSNRRSFLQFDFSSLPAVSPGEIRKATLYLFAGKVEMPGSIDIHALAASWDEKTVTFDTAPVAGALVQAGVRIPAGAENNYVIVDVTAQVQNWVALGLAWNHGLQLAPGAAATNVTFDSKESGARAAFIANPDQAIEAAERHWPEVLRTLAP